MAGHPQSAWVHSWPRTVPIPYSHFVQSSVIHTDEEEFVGLVDEKHRRPGQGGRVPNKFFRQVLLDVFLQKEEPLCDTP